MNIRTLADVSNPKSISNKFRRRRFKYFLKFIEEIPKPVKILDAGGTQSFWEQMGFTSPGQVNITILNTNPVKTNLPNFRAIVGDAREMKMFADNEFDVVFSNSVIEHLGGLEEQKKFAAEVKRAGKKIFIQTPNYYFPVEPHFLFPFFLFLPERVKIFLLMHFSLGWYDKQNEQEKAKELAQSVNLLNFKKIEKLFPYAGIIREKFFFLTKSFIIIS